MPVTRHSASLSLQSNSNHPWAYAAGVAGCTWLSPGKAAASSHSLGLYFMVHDPSG